MKTYGDFDSKFRFVIVAAKRAKQLLKGAKPLIKSKSKNLIRIAQEEVLAGLVEYDIVDSSLEELQVTDGDMFIGQELGINVEDERVEVVEDTVVVEIKKKKSPEESIQEAVKKKVRKKVNENKL
ncbi:MAG: DNA-directed RNA polymerase subunit omega [Candidatus Aminicenantes bacterium]|nr:DNA-directed RNA polymerase subunit omega [Candidatus Aminicenantes bacterium]